MENTELTALVSEMRAEFQIPPYYEDSQLANLAREGECTVGSLNPGCNITTDLTYRMLLKNYMYYAYHHKITWQVSFYSRTPRNEKLIMLRDMMRKKGLHPTILHEFITDDKIWHSYFSLETMNE